MVKIFNVTHDIVCYKRHSLRYSVVIHLVFPLALIKRHFHCILSGADQVFFDLFIRSFDRRYDRNDRCDTYDNSKHGQKGTHLVGPDSLKR